MKFAVALVLTALCPLTLIFAGCKQHSDVPSPAIVHAADQSPSWYITDLGTKVIDDDKFDRIRRGELTVDGMWYATSSIKDKQLVDPIAVKISCDLAVLICREFDATVSMGMLKPDTDDFRISVWDAKHLLAVDENEGKCNITHRLVMDFASRTVTLTDLPSQVDTAECRMLRDANSYVLHDGGVMLYPPAHYDPLAKKKN